MSKVHILVGVAAIVCSMNIAYADFADIDRNSQYYIPTKALQEQGIIQGYADGTYKPEQSVNRAEALKILYTAFDRDTTTTARSGFPDVLTGAWYERFVHHAYGKKYIGGYPDGTFKPGQTVNAVEMYKMLTKVGELPIPTLSADMYTKYKVDKNQWYAQYLVYVLSRNLVDGFDATSIEETHHMSRGEVAALVYRTLYIAEHQLDAFPSYEGGKISYYAANLVGNNTASGDVYDDAKFTASHKTLPLGSWAHVFSEETRTGVVVKVNDRGPYTQGGISDLSSIAFGVMHPLSKGVFTGRVYPLPKDLNGTKKYYHAQAAIPGVTMDERFPSMVMPGELRQIRGKVSGKQVKAVLMLGGAQVYTQTAQVANGAFALDVYFAQDGHYSVDLYVDAVKKGSLSVTSVYMPSEGIGESVYSGAVSMTTRGTEGIDVTWTKPAATSVFRLTFTQSGKEQVIYVPLINKVFVTATMLPGFDFGQPIQMMFEVAHISTLFSHDLNTVYKRITSKITNPVGADQLSVLNGHTDVVEGDTPPNADVATIVTLTNADRKLKGLGSVVYSADLSELAQYKAEDMAKRNYFAHDDPEGKYVNDWKDQFGYIPMVSENIGVANYFSAEDIYLGWHNSPGHYANIIDPSHQRIGVGISKASNGDWYYVQHFSAHTVNGASGDHAQQLLDDLAAKGLVMTRDSKLEAVAEDWAAYLADINDMTFTIDGEGLFDVVRRDYGAGSFTAYVYQLTSLLEAPDALYEDMVGLGSGKNVGIGIVQSANGWINVGVIVKK